MTSMPDIYPIREALRRLESAVARFNATWPHHAQQTVAFEIPVRADNNRANAIEVAPLTGEAAVLAVQSGLAQFARFDEQHPGTVFRLPGLVLTAHDLSAEISLINTLKGRIREYMLQIPANQRARFARQALPGVNLLQVYREIDFFTLPFDTVYFSWAAHTTTNQRMDASQMWERILQMGKPDGMSDEAHQVMLDEQRKALAQHPEVVIRRVKAPHPRIQFKQSGNASVSGRILPASIPVFALLHPEQPAPTVHPLGSFVESRARKTRTDAMNHEPIIPSLNVYTIGAQP